MHENAKGDLRPAGRLSFSIPSSRLALNSTHGRPRCIVRSLPPCCTAGALRGKANPSQLAFLCRLRQVRDCEPQTVSVAAAGERQSLLDARHNGRPRLVCILDVSEDVFGDGEMVDRLCDAVEAEIISPGEIHQSQQEDP